MTADVRGSAPTKSDIMEVLRDFMWHFEVQASARGEPMVREGFEPYWNARRIVSHLEEKDYE